MQHVSNTHKLMDVSKIEFGFSYFFFDPALFQYIVVTLKLCNNVSVGAREVTNGHFYISI